MRRRGISSGEGGETRMRRRGISRALLDILFYCNLRYDFNYCTVTFICKIFKMLQKN